MKMLAFRGARNVCFIFPENIVKQALSQRGNNDVVGYKIKQGKNFQEVSLIHRNGESKIFSSYTGCRKKKKRKKRK